MSETDPVSPAPATATAVGNSQPPNDPSTQQDPPTTDPVKYPTEREFPLVTPATPRP